MRYLKVAFAAVSGLVAAAGLVLFFLPGLPPAVVCTALGGLSVVYGAVKLLGYFSDDLYRLAFQFDLAVGILTSVGGAVLLLRPEDLTAFLPVVVGAAGLVDSALRIQTSIDAKQFGMKKWWLILAASLGGALLSVLLLLRPFGNGPALVRLMGIALVADGLENLIAGLYTVRVPRRACAGGDGSPGKSATR